MDFSASKSGFCTIKNPPRDIVADTEISSVLPDWQDDMDLVGDIFEFDLGAVTTESAPKHEFQVVSSKKFKKLRRRADKEAVKHAANEVRARQEYEHARTAATSPSILKIVCLAMCLLVTTQVGDAASVDTTTYTSALHRDSIDSELFGQDHASINSTVPESPPECETTKTPIYDPYLTCLVNCRCSVCMLCQSMHG